MTAVELKKIRSELGWTQEALARTMGLTVGCIRRWEGGGTISEAFRMYIEMVRDRELKTRELREA